MGCSDVLKTCTEFALYIFNVVLFIGGIVVLSFGVLMTVKLYKYENLFQGGSLKNVALVAIALGALMATTSVLGIFGMCKNSSRTIKVYGILVLLLLVVEFALGITVYSLRDSEEKVIQNSMMKTLDLYDNSTSVKTTWNFVQPKFECCGVNSYKDWSLVRSMNHRNTPDSCCKTESKDCGKGALTDPHPADKINTAGCFPKMLEFIISKAEMLKWGMVSLGLLQIVMMVMGCCLAKKYSSDDSQLQSLLSNPFYWRQ